MPHLRPMLALALLVSWTGLATAADVVLSSGASRETDGREPARLVSTLAIRGFAREGWSTEASFTRHGAGVNSALSAWWHPHRMAYAGGGANLERRGSESLLVGGEIRNRLGYHVGGGFVLPLTNETGLDLSARYVFLDRHPGDPAPDRFASRFWTLTLGVAFRI